MIKPEEIQTAIKGAILPLVPKENLKELNSAVWAVSKQLSTQCNAEIRSQKKELEEKVGNENISAQIQKFMDNPMSEDEEAKALRAIYHMNLSSGELSPQLLDKLDKIIGVSTGKDEVIQSVDFKDAFKSYAEAIEFCRREKPETD
ncbi:MAG: hypothetical protein ACR2PH_07545 [Desulfobulbia bacterium]